MDAISVFVGIGLMVAIIKLSSAYSKRMAFGSGAGPWLQAKVSVADKAGKGKQVAMSNADKAAALAAYQSLVKDKLDVLKTALAMGYDEHELSALDERLERLIGKEQLARIAAGQPAQPSSELLAVSNLEIERHKLQEMRQQVSGQG